jgi:hypothetical protein
VLIPLRQMDCGNATSSKTSQIKASYTNKKTPSTGRLPRCADFVGVEMLRHDLSGTFTRCQIDRTPPPSAGCKEGELDLWVPYASWGAMDAILEEPILPLLTR